MHCTWVTRHSHTSRWLLKPLILLWCEQLLDFCSRQLPVANFIRIMLPGSFRPHSACKNVTYMAFLDHAPSTFQLQNRFSLTTQARQYNTLMHLSLGLMTSGLASNNQWVSNATSRSHHLCSLILQSGTLILLLYSAWYQIKSRAPQHQSSLLSYQLPSLAYHLRVYNYLLIAFWEQLQADQETLSVSGSTVLPSKVKISWRMGIQLTILQSPCSSEALCPVVQLLQLSVLWPMTG